MALFDARSVAHMPAITFTNLYILYLLWHYQWQDCAAGSEQRAAALLTCSLPAPPCSFSPLLLSHFVAHTSLSLPVPEPQSAMTLHRQNCMLIASSQLQTKPNQTAQLRQLQHTRPGHAPPHSNIHCNRKSMRSHYASDDSESQPGQSQTQRQKQSQRITDQLKFRPGRQTQTTISNLAK